MKSSIYNPSNSSLRLDHWGSLHKHYLLPIIFKLYLCKRLRSFSSLCIKLCLLKYILLRPFIADDTLLHHYSKFKRACRLFTSIILFIIWKNWPYNTWIRDLQWKNLFCSLPCPGPMKNDSEQLACNTPRSDLFSFFYFFVFGINFRCLPAELLCLR